MSTSLHDSISQLAAKFAKDIVDAIRSASLGDIHGVAHESAPAAAPNANGDAARTARRPRGRPRKTLAAPAATAAAKPPTPPTAPMAKTAAKTAAPRPAAPLKRRSPADIARVLAKVVALVKEKGPLRSEHIQKLLGVTKNELPRVLQQGLETRALKSKGEKRSRTYTAA